MYLSFPYLPSFGVDEHTKHFLTSLIQVFAVCIWQKDNHNTKPVIVIVILVIILWWFSMKCSKTKTLRPIYKVRLCRIQQAYGRPTTFFVTYMTIVSEF